MSKFKALLALALAALLTLFAACVVQVVPPELEMPPTTTAASQPDGSADPLNPNTAGYPANWWVGQLELAPNPARVGQAVTVWANVYMTDLPMSYINAYLVVNGEVMASQQLVIVFDDSIPFSFTFTPAQPGAYEVTVRAILAENETSSNPAVSGLFASDSGSLTVTA